MYVVYRLPYLWPWDNGLLTVLLLKNMDAMLMAMHAGRDWDPLVAIAKAQIDEEIQTIEKIEVEIVNSIGQMKIVGAEIDAENETERKKGRGMSSNWFLLNLQF